MAAETWIKLTPSNTYKCTVGEKWIGKKTKSYFDYLTRYRKNQLFKFQGLYIPSNTNVSSSRTQIWDLKGSSGALYTNKLCVGHSTLI